MGGVNFEDHGPLRPMGRLGTGAMWESDPDDRIEVRLLGPLQVRRADGSLIHPREWRTGKTVDLLRILATRSGQAVSIDEILESLWPEVDEHRGRGSLRNALGQLRKLLGQSAIERRPDGLVLRDAWVDTTALLSLADEARRHARDGRLALAVKVAREADALHLGEFQTHDPDALWAVPVRENLEARFRELILDAAEHAVDLGWMRDGLELGQRALDADPTSERAYRVLMKAFAGLGETERALRTYERCRAVLAEDLGIDPAAQTRALHMQILSAEPSDAPTTPFVGRARELDVLVAWLRDRGADGSPSVVYLSGAESSGRTRLVREAAARLGAPVLEAAASQDDPGAAVTAALTRNSGSSSGRAAVAAVGSPSRPPVVLVTADRLSPLARQELLRSVAELADPVTVVVRLSGWAETLLAQDVEAVAPGAPSALAVQLLPVAPAALEELATVLLSGAPSPALLDELASCTDGLPGRVVDTIDAWSKAGQLATTAEGLALVPAHDGSLSTPELAGLLARAMEHLSARDQSILHLVVLLDRPVRPALLGPLLQQAEEADGDAAPVLTSLDRLVDLQLLKHSPEGYVARDPFLRQAVESWLRPSVRRRLHAQIAQEAVISAAERGRHWRAAGEPELATAAAIDAVREAMDAGDVSGARVQLLVVTELAERTAVHPTILAELEESLADVCAAAGRIEEAVQHYGRAGELAGGADREAARRLEEKTAALHARPAEPPVPDAPEPATGLPADPDPDDDEAREREAWAYVARADAQRDAADMACARMGLALLHLLPRRRLVLAREVTADAIRLAGGSPVLATAVSLHHLADVLLGHARAAEQPLDQAWSLVERGTAEAGHLAVMRCLVAHDLGRRDFDLRWAEAMEVSPPASEEVDWTWARVRILTERGSLAEAIEEDRRPLREGATPLGRQLRAVASAELLAALGRGPEAVQVLQDAMGDAEEESCSLLMPEITAKLVALTAASDPDTAITLFELFDWVTGSDIGYPREGYLRLLARAAVRAGHGELDRAAAAAANAARIAQDCGLVLLASEAYLAQAQYLFEGGWSAGARVATAGAARCLRAAGTVG